MRSRKQEWVPSSSRHNVAACSKATPTFWVPLTILVRSVGKPSPSEKHPREALRRAPPRASRPEALAPPPASPSANTPAGARRAQLPALRRASALPRAAYAGRAGLDGRSPLPPAKADRRQGEPALGSACASSSWLRGFPYGEACARSAPGASARGRRIRTVPEVALVLLFSVGRSSFGSTGPFVFGAELGDLSIGR
jgi:hypothetical protein